MPDVVAKAALPPEVRRFSGLYRFIDPERFAELGIDPEDVPLGTYPAEDHPPFLPDRLGGNAYGLGLFEQATLPPEQASLVEGLDLADSEAVAANHRQLNDIFKRLGLLIRYTSQGAPFFLIPRQFVAHFLVEVRARADEIIAFLSGLMVRRLRETMRVGLLSAESELLLPELASRMPHLEFVVLESLEQVAANREPLEAVVLVEDPWEFFAERLRRAGWDTPNDRRGREDLGYFAAGRLYDLLAEGGELMILADRPLASTNDTMQVSFKNQLEFKRFLMFSHVYRTRRRYQSGAGMSLEVNRFDFYSFLSGLGVYHETVEGLLEGRSLAYLEPQEIDGLTHQDLPLPRGSDERLLNSWSRWFGAFFSQQHLGTALPEAQERAWAAQYVLEGSFPETLCTFQGARRQPPETLAAIASRVRRKRIAGCDRELLAAYKDSFAYVLRVLDILERVRQGTYTELPGLELSRLRKPFETVVHQSQLKDVRRLMELAPRLARLEQRLNPGKLLGPRTPVLDNLEKLSLMGVEAAPLLQLYLMVLGHSTMTRVTFGKLPENSLGPLTDLSGYQDLAEAVEVVRLYRLLSVAEAAAANPGALSRGQAWEMFTLYDKCIRVLTEPELTWDDILDEQISQVGGVQAKATRKLLKLFGLFEHLEDWQRLEMAGPREKEALAGFDQLRLERVNQVIELVQQLRRFVEHFYAGDSSVRPYFFRALLVSELHGSGRLLPSLGTAASFTLLWICVHLSEKHLINFNPLLANGDEDELAGRLAKLRRALLAFSPQDLPPDHLARLRRSLATGGEAYLGDSGIYFSLDPATVALMPHFMDPHQELSRLGQLVSHTQSQALAEVPARRLAEMDRCCHELECFLRAQPQPQPGELAQMSEELRRLRTRLERHLLDELLVLPRFSLNLGRLLRRCPRIMERLLPQDAQHPMTRRRLAAAAKLSAMGLRRLEGFQDMQLSHEMARQEFGAAAAGIVGATPLQFQRLTASLAQLLDVQPYLGRLMMLAVLLYEEGEPPAPESLEDSVMLAHLDLTTVQHQDLAFLLEHQGLFRQIIFGEACLVGLQPLLENNDPPMVEVLFIMAVVCGAARREGYLTEDLLERYFALLDLVRRLSRKRTPARQAQDDLVADNARRRLALERYLEVQTDGSPATSLRYLMENTRLPDEGRESWLAQGRVLTGINRLLQLRGLVLVDCQDLFMLYNEVPLKYIYRLKALRSVGVTHFERDLYEGRRVLRGLEQVRPEVQEFLLQALSDSAQAVRLAYFAPAAERLTYLNQVRLLVLGLAAAGLVSQGDGRPVTVSFAPLARVMGRKFEMVNELVSSLDAKALVQNPEDLKRLVGAKEGLSLILAARGNKVSLAAEDSLRLDRKIEAVRRASSPGKLKRLYHDELKKLSLTAHRNVDYQQRLEEAFQASLERLGSAMLERVGQTMAAVEDLARLEEVFKLAWEQGQELPLGPDRQGSLRDLFEMNAERLRAQLLERLTARLERVGSFQELDELWQRAKNKLAEQSRYVGQPFHLEVARRFDRRAQELRGRARPTL
ncbi:hypothetical protein [Desulfoferula mesophila]|uniref:Uncharacterized protein n=1 Tax=Desulfoferula mesophila TaxID=3058419 RepID=A0AAU9EX61_9BACT|nr:hypothetical protein FAK_04630 [Desulfoferula mesophilus]